RKSTYPPAGTPACMVKTVPLPAVALLEKMNPLSLVLFAAARKFSVVPELLVTPAPLTVSLVEVGAGLIVNALAPELNTMLLTVTLAERATAVVLERAKGAISFEPLGTVAGVQLAA